MLQDQLERGNNGLIKNKYLTFGIEADGYKTAKPRLERLETDILNNFRKLGVKAEPLDGRARLALMHGIFHIDGQEQFKFSWDLLAPSGLSVRDFIAPSSFEFASSKHFKMGAKYGAVSFLNILAPELNDRLLADLLDMDSSLVVSMYVKALDQLNAIKTVKRKLTELNATKIQEQKKAVSEKRIRHGHTPKRPRHIRHRGAEALAGAAIPQREDVSAHVRGREHRGLAQGA